MAKKMTEEQREALVKKYKELDVNGDGSISLEEFTKGTLGYAKKMREEVWRTYNSNQDDGLSRDEYLDE